MASFKDFPSLSLPPTDYHLAMSEGLPVPPSLLPTPLPPSLSPLSLREPRCLGSVLFGEEEGNRVVNPCQDSWHPVLCPVRAWPIHFLMPFFCVLCLQSIVAWCCEPPLEQLFTGGLKWPDLSWVQKACWWSLNRFLGSVLDECVCVTVRA